MAKGSEGYLFVEDHWVPHLPTVNPREQYLAVFEQVIGSLAPALAHMTACAVHTCSGNWQALRWQIEAAYQAGVNELNWLKHSRSPCSPAAYLTMCAPQKVWRQLIIEGTVTASDLFKEWANISGQGGYDEVSGVKDP